MFIWNTPPTSSAVWAFCAADKVSYLLAKSFKTPIAGRIVPFKFFTWTPRPLSWSTTSVLLILVKIVLSELPITGPPRAVVCCTAVTAAINSSIPNPASSAVAPTRLIAFARSAELTAKAASTLAILLTIWVLVRVTLLNEFMAAVRASTEFFASNPERRIKIIASFVLWRVFSTPKPCLENSVAASATSLNDLPVFDATWKRSLPNLIKFFWLLPRITFISANFFSTLTVAFAISRKPAVTAYIAPAEAPKAATRALEAARDLLNSLTLPVILPKGWEKDRSLILSLSCRDSAFLTNLWSLLSAALVFKVACPRIVKALAINPFSCSIIHFFKEKWP